MSGAREADAADLGAVLALEARCFDHDPWTRGMLEVELGRPGGHFLVLEQEGALVGMAIAWRVIDELHVLHVGVDPAYRQRGLGRLLMDALEASAPEATVAWLEVRSDNAPAIALYAGRGYRPVAVRARYYDDGCDAVVMRKSRR